MGRENRIITNPRQLAVLCAYEVETNQKLVPEAIASIPFKLKDDDLKLAHEIIYGTFRYQPGLYKFISQLCKPAKTPPQVWWVLMTSLYQLLYMRTPDYAVLNEANNLARALGFGGLRGLVNGVLRNAQRKKDTITKDWTDADWLLSPWMAQRFNSQYGSDEVAAWLKGWGQWSGQSYWSAKKTPLEGDLASDALPHAYRRRAAVPQDAYETHGIYVQNESSQAVAEIACRLQPESVIDLCAAPGGKVCYVASFSSAKRIVANDLPGERIGRLRENKERLALNFDITQSDARHIDSEPFDLVMLDAPCSGIGIIGRHPEIKFLKAGAADDSLKNLQAELMAAAWSLVKPGGHLLYTVCSLDQEEIPSPPEGATPRVEAGVALLEGLPLKIVDGHFYFPPGGVFDGFRGILLQK